MGDIDRLREEYEIRHDIEVADALIAALGDEIAELTGQNIDLEVWRASAVKRAEQAEAEVAQRCATCSYLGSENDDTFVCRNVMAPSPMTDAELEDPSKTWCHRWVADLRARAEKEIDHALD